jgi:hypothetical protein
VPRFIWLLRSPLGRIITRVPEQPRMVAKQLAGLGHATGSQPGQIPAAFVDWRLAQSRETDWRRFVGRMPRGELELVDGGGHMVWYDDPSRVGARVTQFLST